MPRTGRPRRFTEQEALARARDVFWGRGYAATSVQDLVDALGLQRGSLYGAFGDKHALYLRAVRLYAAENRARLQAALAQDPVLPVLRHLLTAPEALTGAPPAAGVAEGAHDGTDAGGADHEDAAGRGLAVGLRCGCLVGATTAQLAPGDEDARALVAAAFEDFVDDVAAALARGQERGEVASDADPRVQAQLLLVLFQGSALVGRVSTDRAALNAGVDLALGALTAAPAPASQR